MSSICKKCKSDYKHLWYKNNSEKLKEQSKNYYSDNKEKIRQKHVEYSKQFYRKNSDKIKLYRRANLVHFREYRRVYDKENAIKLRKYRVQYREDNLVKIKEYEKQYRTTPKAKEILKQAKRISSAVSFLNGGSYTSEHWKECLIFFNYRCAYTGEVLKYNNTHVEHIIPISKEGTNYIWNICPSIDYANLSKNDNNMEEWYRQQRYFSEERLQKIYLWIEYAKFMF